MAIHLFSIPVQCTQCGTVVDDPTIDRCPNCGKLLTERRAPSRLAGVPRRFGQLRLLLGLLRFLAVAVFAISLLLSLFGDEGITVKLWSLLGGLVIAAGLFVVAASIEIILDIEENTRASFRIQQLILAELRQEAPPAVDPQEPS